MPHSAAPHPEPVEGRTSPVAAAISVRLRGREKIMRAVRLALVFAMAILLPRAPAFAGSITAATGRRIEIPAKVERVLPAGQPAAAIVYALAPQKMLGWPRKPNAAGMAFLLPEVRDLPEIG